jgi:hypothetical protein
MLAFVQFFWGEQPVRWGFGCLALALLLSACAENKAARLAADWGCGPVGGIEAITGDAAPDWLLVGEFTETSEAPAAVADIACNLATDERKLFVGVSDYFGGATDAETAMLADLKEMIARGAPMVISHIGAEDHAYTVRDRSKAEKAWAAALAGKVAAAGAAHALLFVSRTDAIAHPIKPDGERFAGYSPMPVFLKGGVFSLEIAPQPGSGASGPAIRVYPARQGGFDGQLVLASLTRPRLAPVIPLDAAPFGAGAAADTGDTQIPSAIDPEDQMLLQFGDGPISPITVAEYQEIFDQLIEGLPEWAPE